MNRYTRNTGRPPVVRKAEDGKRYIEGYAAVFYDEGDEGTEYWLWKDFCERIDPHAFDRAMKEKHPARSFVNHSANRMLGRLDKGTLSLRVDDKGLFYSVEVPDSETGRQAVADVDCGNLDGASFMFNITGSKWEDVQDGDSWTTYRTITDLDLLECGPVAMPAYTATTSALRAIAEDRVKDALAERDEWRRANRRSEITDVEIRATELALAEMD